VFEKKKVR